MSGKPHDAPRHVGAQPNGWLTATFGAIVAAALLIAADIVGINRTPAGGAPIQTPTTPVVTPVARYATMVAPQATTGPLVVVIATETPTPVPTDDPSILTPEPTTVVCDALHGTPSPTGLCVWATLVPTLAPAPTPFPVCDTPVPRLHCRPANSLDVTPVLWPTDPPTVAPASAAGHYG